MRSAHASYRSQIADLRAHSRAQDAQAAVPAVAVPASSPVLAEVGELYGPLAQLLSIVESAQAHGQLRSAERDEIVGTVVSAFVSFVSLERDFVERRLRARVV